MAGSNSSFNVCDDKTVNLNRLNQMNQLINAKTSNDPGSSQRQLYDTHTLTPENFIHPLCNSCIRNDLYHRLRRIFL